MVAMEPCPAPRRIVVGSATGCCPRILSLKARETQLLSYGTAVLRLVLTPGFEPGLLRRERSCLAVSEDESVSGVPPESCTRLEQLCRLPPSWMEKDVMLRGSPGRDRTCALPLNRRTLF